MHKLIIVCGLPGSGKTMLADELSKRAGIVCIHKDSIKEKLFEGLGMSTLEESKSIGKISVDVMLYIAKQQIENGVDIIIESPFNFPYDYGLFLEWIDQYGVSIFSIICSIGSEERKRRVDTRERHAAHLDCLRANDFFSDKEYDYAGIPGKQIRVCTDEPLSYLVEKVISELH